MSVEETKSIKKKTLSPEEVKAIGKKLSALAASRGTTSEDKEVEAKLETPAAKKRTRKKSVAKETIEDTGVDVILEDKFIVKTGLYKLLKRNVERNVNTMLLGETGSGKTELVYYLSKSLGLPITIFDMSTMSDPIMSLIGNHVIKTIDGRQESLFVPSRFSQVIQKPGVILLDELSRASMGAANILFPCLDFRRELPMEYCFDDCEPIKVHPECVFFATANVGSDYSGTNKIDRALLDRFLTIETENLTEESIRKVLQGKYKIENDIFDKMLSAYLSLRKMHGDFSCTFTLSFRHLKQICTLVEDGFTLYDSYYSICKGIASERGVKEISTILNNLK